MRKLAILVLSLILCISLFPLSAFATGETFGLTLHFGDQKMTLSGQTSYTLPEVSAPTGQSLAGWYAEATDDKAAVFLPVGATVTADIATELTAVFVGMKTRTDAELRLVEGEQGLRFYTDIVLSDFVKLCDIATVSVGTLIIPEEYLLLTDDVLTHAAVMEKTRYKRYVDVVAEGAFAQTAVTYTVAGSIVGILPQNTDREFCAAGYLKLTYTDGSEGYVYSSTRAMGSCSLYKKAVAAFSDRADVQDSKYTNRSTYGFSPYTADELTYLQSVLDSVVNLTFVQVDGVWVPQILPVSPAYTAPFTVTGTKNKEHEFFCLMVREGVDYRFDEDFYILLEDGALRAIGGSSTASRYKILATSNGRVMEVDFNAYG